MTRETYTHLIRALIEADIGKEHTNTFPNVLHPDPAASVEYQMKTLN